MTSTRTVTLLLALALAPGCGGSTPPSAVHLSATAGTPRDANMSREAIPDRFRWNLAPLFESEAAFAAGLDDAARRRTELQTSCAAIAEPERLEGCLSRYFETRLLTNRLTTYSSLRQSTEQESSEASARVERAQAAMSELMALAAGVRDQILALDEPSLARAYAARPALAEYRPYIDQIRRRRAHVLGAEAERVLSLAGDNLFAEIDLNELPSDQERAFQSLVSELPLPTITDENGAEVQLTLSNFGLYRRSSDRRVRRDAVEGLFGALRAFDQSFAALLGGQARESVFLARARGYPSALDAYLDRDEIDPAVYRNLIATVEANLAPLHRYVRLRRERMGLDELHVYDLYTPLVPTVETHIPFEEARGIVAEALTPLGDDYLAVVREGLDPANGWIDVYPHAQKQSGAYCASVYGAHPFVFINYFEGLEDMRTLAHEFGHAIHSHLTSTHQPYVTSSYVAMVAETASTTNEVLVMRHLIERAGDDDAQRLYLLGQLVEAIRQTIYRQALFASFELAVHTAVENGTPVTAELLDQTYAGLVRRYYGDGLALGANDGMEWAYVPHFYYKYYVYSYAVGLSSGIALAERILSGGAAARDGYLDMLSAGSSRPPVELLRAAGVDPSRPEAIEAAARLFDASLSEMEAILARQR